MSALDLPREESRGPQIAGSLKCPGSGALSGERLKPSPLFRDLVNCFLGHVGQYREVLFKILLAGKTQAAFHSEPLSLFALVLCLVVFGNLAVISVERFVCFIWDSVAQLREIEHAQQAVAA